MVKTSKKNKSKSKRVPLKKKHKIIRKVKEHQKKKAKNAKQLGLNKKPKAEKETGIPNDWPFKEQELKALEVRRQCAIQEREDKKAARKERAHKRNIGLVDDEETEGDGEESNTESFTRKVADNSDKAFEKELNKVIDESDVILEVLDARDPLGTRSVKMEQKFLKTPGKIHLVLVLNKIDLVPQEAARKWLEYFKGLGFTVVAFKCSTQEQKSNLGWKSAPKACNGGKMGSHLQTSGCIGAKALINLLKTYSTSFNIKNLITVGIIGLPNVGKSSIINSLKRSHVVNVGSTPGLTRFKQEVHLDKNVRLLDCPGVVMLESSENDASIALRNCKRIEKLDDPIGHVKEIVKLCPERVLVTLYNVPTFDSVEDFLQKVAAVRGKLKKGGVVDVDATARIILHDWNEGKIPYYTMPPIPKRNADEPSEATVVTELGKEFNVDEVYGGESSYIGSLKTMTDVNPVEVPSVCPLNFHMAMVEDTESPKDNNDDESMKSGDVNTIVKEKSATHRQNEKLYGEEGMLNTKMRKSVKKRRKQVNQASTMDYDYDANDDYTVDYAMETGGKVVADETEYKNIFELLSGE